MTPLSVVLSNCLIYTNTFSFHMLKHWGFINELFIERYTMNRTFTHACVSYRGNETETNGWVVVSRMQIHKPSSMITVSRLPCSLCIKKVFRRLHLCSTKTELTVLSAWARRSVGVRWIKLLYVDGTGPFFVTASSVIVLGASYRRRNYPNYRVRVPTIIS